MINVRNMVFVFPQRILGERLRKTAHLQARFRAGHVVSTTAD